MESRKFDVVFAGTTVAENLELDIALVLVEALINKFYNQVGAGAPALIRISKNNSNIFDYEKEENV